MRDFLGSPRFRSARAMGVALVLLLVVAGSASAGPLQSFRETDLSRPARGFLGVWSLVGVYLIHVAICASILGWAFVFRAARPHRQRRMRTLIEERPFVCFFLGVLNWIVVLLVVRAAARHFPGFSLLLTAVALWGTVCGIAGIIEAIGTRMEPTAAEMREEAPNRRWPALTRGGVALGLATGIPLFGQVLSAIAFCVGLGAAFLSVLVPTAGSFSDPFGAPIAPQTPSAPTAPSADERPNPSFEPRGAGGGATDFELDERDGDKTPEDRK
jgi:hypothetical protein